MSTGKTNSTDQKGGSSELPDESLYKLIVEEAIDAIFLTTLKGEFVYSNSQGINLLGYSIDELQGMTLDDVIDPTEVRENPVEIGKLMAGKKLLKRRRIINKKGEVIQTEFSSSMMPNGMLMGIVRNISNRMDIEKALRESEERYRNIVEQAPIGIVVHQQGKIVWVNPNVLTIMREKSLEDIIGKPVIDFVHPASRPIALERIKILLTQGKEAPLVEEIFVRRDGTELTVQVAARHIQFGGELAVQTIFQDITELKNTSSALEESEKNFRNLFENAPVGIYKSNRVGKLKMVNNALVKMLGYQSQQEMLELDMNTQVYANAGEREKLINHYIATGKVIDLEIQWKKKNGDLIWISMNATAHKDKNGNVQYFDGFIRDISARKVIEQELLASRENYFSLFEYSPISLWEVDFSKLIVLIDSLSKKALRDLEKNPETNMPFVAKLLSDIKLINTNQATLKLLNLKDKDDFYIQGPGLFTRESAIQFCHSILKLYKGETSGMVETSFNKSTGEPINILLNWHLNDAHRNSWERVLLSIIDITERKKAENAFRTSEEKFRGIIENSTNLFYTHTADHILTYVSPQCKDFLGCDPEEALINWTNFITDNPVNELGFKLTQKAIDTGKKQKPFLLEINSKNNQVKWVEVNERPIVIDGKTTAIIGSLTDITAKKVAEEKLRQSEQKFSNAFHQSGTGMLLFDPATEKITDVNTRFCRMVDNSKNEILHHGLTNLIFNDDRRPFRKSYEILLTKRRSIVQKEVRFLGKNNTIIWCLISLSLVRASDLSPVSLIVQVQNISEIKNLEFQLIDQNEKLKASAADLQRKNQQLEEFNQIVSHNLRAPVGNIRSLVQSYNGAISKKQKEQTIDYLGTSGKALSDTLDELNEVLRIRQSGKIETSNLKFETLLNRTLSLLQTQIEKVNARVITDFDSLPTIKYSRIYLESIFMNLISNAIKYANPGKRPVITIKSFASDGKKIIEIGDNGLGIDLDRHGGNIFKMYKTFHRHPESRGIGLFIVKNQVEAMGGTIEVKSKPGKGSTFKIILTQ